MADTAFRDLLALLMAGIGAVGNQETGGVSSTMGVKQIRQDGIPFIIQTAELAAQDGTGEYVVVEDSGLDARGWRSLAYTIAAATADLLYKVFGANASDYSDEVEVKAETTVASGAAGSYTAVPPPFGYYRVKIKNAGETTGTATVRGLAK